MNAKDIINDLFTFTKNSATAYQAVESIKSRLDETGFEEVFESSRWSIIPGGRYYVQRNGTSLIAFVAGNEVPGRTGFFLTGAHTDSPGFKLKGIIPQKDNGGWRLPVEVYGGPIHSAWLDRGLAIAGTVVIEEGGESQRVPVDLKRPMVIIPNAAIHLNREINKGVEYNAQTQLAAYLSGPSEEAPDLTRKLLEAADLPDGDLKYADLFLYNPAEGEYLGIDETFYTSPRIDNLAGCQAILEGIKAADPAKGTAVAAFFDNEEIGSKTLQGADSTFLIDVLERIVLARGGDREDLHVAKALSVMISVDGAHAVHPGYADKSDPVHGPVLNGGPVLKLNANQRYATDGEGAELFRQLCDAADAPLQHFYMRSGLPCGSTIGTISSSVLGIKTLDVGIPLLAMHSSCETAGNLDQYYLVQVLKQFYGEDQ